MLTPSKAQRPTRAPRIEGRRSAQLIAGALLAFALTSTHPAEGQDVCREVQRTIDVEAASTNDPRALVRLAPSVGAQAVPALIQRTKSTDEEIAFSAFLAIGLSRHADALRLLRDAPRPKSPVVRLGRSLALLAIGDGAETATISHALYEGTVGERRRTAAALAQMPQKRPQLMLFAALEDPDELVRLEAARVLWSGSARVRRVLTETFKSGSTTSIKSRAASAMLRAGYGFRPEDMAALTAAQKMRATIGDAARGRRLSLRSLSAQIRSSDPLLRAAAFAAVALAGGADSPAQLKKLEKTLMPKEPIPEAIAALALIDAGSVKTLETLDRAGIERALAVFYVFSSANLARAQLDPDHAGQLARVAEAWIARGELDETSTARAIRTMERFDPFAGLLLARARLSGEDGRSVRAAVRVIGRSGSLGDLPPLVALAKKSSPQTRSEALRAAARVCAR